MAGDKKIMQSELLTPGLNSDPHAKMNDQNPGSRKVGIASGVTSSFSGVTEQGFHYTPTSCYDYQYPGHNGAYSQLDGHSQPNPCEGAYPDNGSLLYYMPGYPYATMGQQHQPYFSSSAMGSNRMKSNDFYSKRNMNAYSGKSPNYPLDMKPRQQPTSGVPRSVLQSQHIRSLNKLGSAYQSTGSLNGYQPTPNYSSFSYQNQGLFSMNYPTSDRFKSRERSYPNGESEELTRGPRAQTLNVHLEDEKLGISLTPAKEKYNLEGFQTKHDEAKFYVIKSYSEDDVHKCIKYDVWSSTPNGNKKLDAAFRDSQGKTNIFLFFSVNGSGQFVGVAEMIGPVDYEKNKDFWQLDKWNGFFPVKWHIVKDVPNTLLRHIILENNDNRPVTYTRDTQEVGLKQGMEMLEIFKSYSAKTSLLDDLSFYENREKLLKSKRISRAAFESEKNRSAGIGEGSMKDPTSSLINLTRKLSLNPNSPKGD